MGDDVKAREEDVAKGNHPGRLWRRKDLAYEPVREQEIQQPVRSSFLEDLVGHTNLPLLVFRYKATIGADFLTKEVLVDDRLITMQVGTRLHFRF